VGEALPALKTLSGRMGGVGGRRGGWLCCRS
jgi:hypothetical protein